MVARRIVLAYDADIVSGATPRTYGGGMDAVSAATTFSDVRHAIHGGAEVRLGPVTVETYQWFVRNAGQISSAYTIVICDEAHTALGEKTSAAIRSFPEPVFIGMTATEQLIAKQVSDVFPASVDDLPLQDAARRKRLIADAAPELKAFGKVERFWRTQASSETVADKKPTLQLVPSEPALAPRRLDDAFGCQHRLEASDSRYAARRQRPRLGGQEPDRERLRRWLT